MPLPPCSTFSIVACDPAEREWGVAVASKFLAVGSVVPWARAGVGAVATQSYVNATYGPLGLAMMEQGYPAQQVADALVAGDPGRDQRQVGVVDAQGGSATFTGSACHGWAGGRTGRQYAAQGNILTGPEVVDRMADAFERTPGLLADRLLVALTAGQDAGGDSRGRQSAALYIAKPKGGYGGLNDRFVDLRVDDHPDPIVELERLLGMHKLYMFPTRPEDVLPIDAEIAETIWDILVKSGQYQGTPGTAYNQTARDAFWSLCGRENLEGRWREGNEVDRVVLSYLSERYL